MTKLNQVLAVERSVKTRVQTELSELHKLAQKASLFEGFLRTYAPLADTEESLPDERQMVQRRASDALRQVSQMLTERFDVILTKDSANQNAKADLVVEGKTLVSGVPATSLLALEKELVDINTFIEKMPTLDAGQNWSMNTATGLFQSEPVQTSKTKKIQKPLVLYPATNQHPAQTQMITEDAIVGTWTNVKQSGAMRPDDKQAILERVRKLQKAVKYAREQANLVDAPERTMGDAVFSYLLG